MCLAVKPPVLSAMSCHLYMCIATNSASHPQNCKHATVLDFALLFQGTVYGNFTHCLLRRGRGFRMALGLEDQ